MKSLEQQVWDRLHRRLWARWKVEDSTVPTKLWTTDVFMALYACRAEVARAFSVPTRRVLPRHHNPAVPGASTEHLVDFALVTYPGDGFSVGRQPSATGTSYGVLLAAESEWGKESSAPANYWEVMRDLCKLLDLRAGLKVFIYSSHIGARRAIRANDIVRDVENLLRSHAGFDKRERWLFCGVPWDSEAWAPAVHVVQTDGDGAPSLVTPSWAPSGPGA